ncbi:MAG: alpha/beta hydrolase [Ectothiorhodospira sp.]
MPRIQPLSTAGLLVGTLFFAFSLTPSLIPRPFVFQGILGGLSFTAGYAIGSGLSGLWCYLQLPRYAGPARRTLRWLVAIACALVAALFIWDAPGWQDSVRRQMELEPVGGVQPIGVAALTVTVFTVALLFARLFRQTFRFLSGRLQYFIPVRVAHLVGTLVAVVLFWGVLDGVLLKMALRAADNSYQQVDALIEADQERPEISMRTGSPISTVDWEDLGHQGRSFVASGPRAADLEAFHGEPAPTPIRIYIGLNAAETPEARARLALEELLRTDAFERSVLILATPTGTGWIDPGAVDAVEYLHRGDTATVTAQYSYLPSPLALMLEGDYGVETARALFEAVYGHWRGLPEGERPELYLHGLSLGALNSDRSFDLYDVIQDPFDGVLWSGPPFRSETWRTVTHRRDPGSPAWLPTFREGEVVRFMNQHTGLKAPDDPWGSFRIGFLQYASDPITFFAPSIFYQRPDWLEPPRGPDVSPELRWYPVVTALQLIADIAAGPGGSPPGHGHTYAAEDYVDAWLGLTDPEGWDARGIRRLKAHLAGE